MSYCPGMAENQVPGAMGNDSAMPAGLTVPRLGTRTSLREQVGLSLRAALVSGDMVPGVTYSAPALAERFGVSATPVREAMLDLMNEGMVVAVPNKGFRVVETTERDLDEMTELRMLVEVPTVGRLAAIITPEQIAELRVIASRILEAAAQGDVVTYIECDRQFHLDLLRLTGNARLVALVDELRVRTRLYGLARLAEAGALGPTSEEHMELLDALAARDSARVEQIMARHLSHVRGVWAIPDESETASEA